LLIDVHCHTNLYLVLEEIIKEARSVGVEKIISVGMSFTSLERILEISNKFDMIYPALGIHPEEVRMNKEIINQLDLIAEIIKKNSKEICAIGEIGLDYHFIKEKELYPLQIKIFKLMLTLAQELNLPVNLHTKGAEKEVFDLLSSYNIPNVNIHWYSGPEEFLKVGIDRGYYFSITPNIKYSPAIKKTILNVDIEKILLESDGPVRYEGEIGNPTMIRDVLNTISKIKKMDPKELENQIEQNTKKIFPKIF
jgi:TatD DNase family protein